jgi:hypothetical protein
MWQMPSLKANDFLTGLDRKRALAALLGVAVRVTLANSLFENYEGFQRKDAKRILPMPVRVTKR